MRLIGKPGVRRALMGAAAFAATAGVAWGVYQQTMAPAPLESLVPESAFAVSSADARWFWDATGDLRSTPEGTKGLAAAERELHVSMEKDILPWAGQVAGAMLSLDPKETQVAILIEVRNPVEYYASMTRLRTRLERQASRYWKPAEYNGVALRYTYVGTGKHRKPVSTAWLKGWVVVGIGNGSTRRIIDAWQDRKPSIADNAAWMQGLAKRPASRLAWFGVNSGRVVDSLPKGLAAPRAAMDMLELSRVVTVGAVSELEDGFRMVGSTVATAPASRKLYGQIAKIPPVSEDVMDRLPDGTFAAMGISDPGAWWDAYQPMLKGVMAPDPKNAEARKMVDAAMDRYKPIENIVRRCERGMAFGVSYRPQDGFGLAIVGDSGTPETARQSAEDLSEFVQKFDRSVTVSEDRTTYKLFMPAQNQNEAPVQFRPAWSVNGQFLAVASHEMWLTPGTGAERVPLPAETQGAQTVARGDFRFVEPMIRQFGPIGEAAAARARAGAAKAQKPGKATKGKAPATAVKPAIPAPTPEQMAEGWRRTGLGEARWWSASTVHPDGTVDATSELRDWQWRAALRAVAEQQRAKAAAKPARIR